MTLEKEKKKIEEDLEAERALALDKDQLLERSKRREGELEEEVTALQMDLDKLDSQLERCLQGQKATEEKYLALRDAFDEAAEHLIRLEKQEREWMEKEHSYANSLKQRDEELQTLVKRRDALEMEGDELRSSLQEKNQDLRRLKDRMEASVAELESKLAGELKTRWVPDQYFDSRSFSYYTLPSDLGRLKSDNLEKENRNLNDQLAELARTATDYEALLQKKEADVHRLTSDLSQLRKERELAAKRNNVLQGEVETLVAELEAQKEDRERSAQSRAKLEEELDELRRLMEAKTSEDTKRSEVEKSKEQELATLRTQLSTLALDLSEARRTALEVQGKLKVDLEASQREYKSVSTAHQGLQVKIKTIETRQAEVEQALIIAEKAKRSAESDLQSLRTKQVDVDGQLAEAVKAKEVSLSFKIIVGHQLNCSPQELRAPTHGCLRETPRLRGCNTST
jgi:myosin protein heavy chain